MEFEFIIDPLNSKAFFTDVYDIKHLHIQRKSTPRYFDRILTIDDIDEYMQRDDFSSTSFSTVKHGKRQYYPKKKNSRSFTELPAVMDAYLHKGHTIALEFVKKHISKLSVFFQRLNSEYPVRFGCNIYITPPNSRGFDVHSDTHDVFVLQITGSKEWSIYDFEDGLKNSGVNDPQEEPKHKLVVSAGDTLYIPKGLRHSAKTNDAASIHMTLGIYAPLSGENILRKFKEEAQLDPFFSKPLFHLSEKELDKYSINLKEKLIDLVTKLSVKEMIKDIKLDQEGQLLGHISMPPISSLLAIEEILSDTLCKKRVQFAIHTEGKFVKISAFGKSFGYPILTKPVFDQILKNDHFNARNIEDTLKTSPKSALVFLKKLITSGLIIRA